MGIQYYEITEYRVLKWSEAQKLWRLMICQRLEAVALNPIRPGRTSGSEITLHDFIGKTQVRNLKETNEAPYTIKNNKRKS